MKSDIQVLRPEQIASLGAEDKDLLSTYKDRLLCYRHALVMGLLLPLANAALGIGWAFYMQASALEDGQRHWAAYIAIVTMCTLSCIMCVRNGGLEVWRRRCKIKLVQAYFRVNKGLDISKLSADDLWDGVLSGEAPPSAEDVAKTEFYKALVPPARLSERFAEWIAGRRKRPYLAWLIDDAKRHHKLPAAEDGFDLWFQRLMDAKDLHAEYLNICAEVGLPPRPTGLERALDVLLLVCYLAVPLLGMAMAYPLMRTVLSDFQARLLCVVLFTLQGVFWPALLKRIREYRCRSHSKRS